MWNAKIRGARSRMRRGTARVEKRDPEDSANNSSESGGIWSERRRRARMPKGRHSRRSFSSSLSCAISRYSSGHFRQLVALCQEREREIGERESVSIFPCDSKSRVVSFTLRGPTLILALRVILHCNYFRRTRTSPPRSTFLTLAISCRGDSIHCRDPS